MFVTYTYEGEQLQAAVDLLSVKFIFVPSGEENK
jgi:hypothetical protein